MGRICMFRGVAQFIGINPRSQVSIYMTIGPLVEVSDTKNANYLVGQDRPAYCFFQFPAKIRFKKATVGKKTSVALISLLSLLFFIPKSYSDRHFLLNQPILLILMLEALVLCLNMRSSRSSYLTTQTASSKITTATIGLYIFTIFILLC